MIVQSFKPSRDGKAWIVRLFGATGRPAKVTLDWAAPKPSEVCHSDLAESKGEKVAGPIEVPPYGLVTIRAELPQ